MIPGKCKEVGVRRVAYALNAKTIVRALLGTPVYKKTSYIALNNGRQWAIAQVGKKSLPGHSMFMRISSVRVMSLPRNTGFVRDPSVEPLNRSHMAAAYCRQAKDYLVVQGKYEHVSFITGEQPVAVTIVDLAPPGPPHLLELAKTAVNSGMVGAPLRISELEIDIGRLSKGAKTGNVMFPCTCSGVKAAGRKKTLFLDRCPELFRDEARDTTLVGCARSEKIFGEVYGRVPKRITTCPLDHIKKLKIKGIVLTRCCETRQRVRVAGDLVVVPWDVDLRTVARALNAAARLAGRK